MSTAEWINAAAQAGLATLMIVLMAKHVPKAIAAMTSIATALGGMRSDIAHTKASAESAKEAADEARTAAALVGAAVISLGKAIRESNRARFVSDPDLRTPPPPTASSRRGSDPNLTDADRRSTVPRRSPA